MFLVNDKLVLRDKNSYWSPGTTCMVHVMHMHFMLFAVFKNLKSSFSVDNMPEHALDIFIENATNCGVVDTVFHGTLCHKIEC